MSSANPSRAVLSVFVYCIQYMASLQCIQALPSPAIASLENDRKRYETGLGEGKPSPKVTEVRATHEICMGVVRWGRSRGRLQLGEWTSSQGAVLITHLSSLCRGNLLSELVGFFLRKFCHAILCMIGDYMIKTYQL